MSRSNVCTPFDPWTATIEQAQRAEESLSNSADPSPLAQRLAAQEILKSRDAALKPGGGCLVMRCVFLCGINRLVQPDWLAGEFGRRHISVTEAFSGSWDEAFDPPWPRGTRLTLVRERLRLQRQIHSHVMDAVSNDPNISINRALFNRIAAMPGIPRAGGTVERFYYKALDSGMVSAALLKNPNPQQVTDHMRIDSLLHVGQSQSS